MVPQLALLCALLLALIPHHALSRAIRRDAPGFPNPLEDPFYSQPDNISSYSIGEIIATRSTTSSFAATFSNLNSSYQIKFRSTDSLSQPIAAITTVLVPSNKTSTPSGGFSLLSYQTPEDSASLSCSPSWAFVANSASAAGKSSMSGGGPVIGWALNQGFYVTIPDHEGPTSAFIVGTNAGHIVLDAIRATLHSEDLSTDSTQVGLYGYSGGANAAVFASSLAGEYAPELNIIGASMGGTPVSPISTFYYINGRLASGFAGAGAVGIANAYPAVNAYLKTILTTQGNASFANYRASGTCIAQVVTQFALRNFFNEVSPPQDFLTVPVVAAALANETLLQDQAAAPVPTPRHPIFMYHALMDMIVPWTSASEYIWEQCPQGADIRKLTVPLGGHITTEYLGMPTALKFLGNAFNGTLPHVTCGSDTEMVKLGSTESIEIMGAASVAALHEAQTDGQWQAVNGGMS